MPIRIATYNASLYGKKSGEIHERLSDGSDKQARKIAAVVQSVRPDILLINEIDHDPDSSVAKLLASDYFAKPQPIAGGGTGKPIDFPYVLALASNTGEDSGLDLNMNGRLGEPNDAWGYGIYSGQYSMAVFSRFPIDTKQVRSFRNFLWSNFPAAHRPVDPQTQQPYYSDELWKKLRLSSKNHADVPIRVNGDLIHLLVSHPTPPVFDGPEDRNGCRNHDEVRFWTEYIGGKNSSRLVDDRGQAGGLGDEAHFVVMGDLNADPEDGDGQTEAIVGLLSHPRVTDTKPRSAGGAAADSRQKRQGDPAFHTASFGNGNLRLDYVLPSRSLSVAGSGVHWPADGDAGSEEIKASDHRLVWIDVSLGRADPK